VVQGNADADAHENRQWLVGWFKDEADIRHSTDVEVKVSTHDAGETRPGGWSTDEWRRTFFTLTAGGPWRLELADEASEGRGESVMLKEPGDYVVWDEGVAHHWEALGDATVLTVRWPSLPTKPEP
jgi:hypothetical protein